MIVEIYLKLIIIIIAANTQITGDRYSYIIEKDGSPSKYMHGPGYKYTEPYTDGILLNGSFFTKDKFNIAGIDEMAPEMDIEVLPQLITKLGIDFLGNILMQILNKFKILEIQ